MSSPAIVFNSLTIQTKKSADHDTENWESSRQESADDRLRSAVALPSAAFLLLFGEKQSKIGLVRIDIVIRILSYRLLHLLLRAAIVIA